MTKEEKHTIVAELKDKFNENQVFYVADPTGVTVPVINAFRKLCYSKGLEYKVYKNNLIGKALEKQDADFQPIFNVLKGTTGLLFSKESSNLPAKILKEFAKDYGANKITLKAASVNADFFIGKEHLDTLAKLKSKEELVAEVIGLLQSPLKTVIGQLQSSSQTLTSILKTLKDKK